MELMRSLASLSDMVRLRLLRLIEREELSVGELSKILQLPQSTVSRHLKILHDNDWIALRSEGPASLYRMDDAALGANALALWNVVHKQLDNGPTLAEDDHRLAMVLAQRRGDSRTFFGRIVGEWDRLRSELFGERFTSAALVGLLEPEWVVADLGCGTGVTAESLAAVVRKVIAVDREPQMLTAARHRLEGFDNVEYLQDDLTALSLAEATVDAVIVSLVMVYVPRPEAAMAEIARIMKPGGRALIVDMVAHDRESYRHTMGHQHLGFDEARVRQWAGDSGLLDMRYRRLPADTSAKGPGLFVATMSKRR
ncbi:MAG: metalloregulator ArsR/SmtB family transcription factor [Planctomycetes bacterium]|nr:metalloregulator ArsR/SmtB family transcription factor [Planctomycetota bacterium]